MCTHELSVIQAQAAVLGGVLDVSCALSAATTAQGAACLTSFACTRIDVSCSTAQATTFGLEARYRFLYQLSRDLVDIDPQCTLNPIKLQR